jgi:hypothetical protein
MAATPAPACTNTVSKTTFLFWCALFASTQVFSSSEKPLVFKEDSLV